MRLAGIFCLVVAGTLPIACAVPAIDPAPAPSAPSSAASRYAATELRIYELINIERRKHGLPALAWNEQLDHAAKIHAANMARFRKMAHTIPEADLPTLSRRAQHVAYPFGRIAENIALGFPDAESVVKGWMNSTGHRQNILNRDVSETGVGIVRSSSGGLYFCQVFGRRLTSI